MIKKFKQRIPALVRLQKQLSACIRQGRYEDSTDAVSLALRADAILQQKQFSFEVRCAQLDSTITNHLAQRLITRLDSYSH